MVMIGFPLYIEIKHSDIILILGHEGLQDLPIFQHSVF